MLSRLSLFLLALISFATTQQTIAQDDLTIYLFRHAETTSEGRDPDLSERGQQRAKSLLTIINQENVDHLFSTPLNRTIQTIIPFSDYYDLEIEHYDYRDLEGFADQLLNLTGVVLVSGHSNTTPSLVTLLTGIEIPPIDESEYDNLFIISFVNGHYTLSVLNFPPFYKTKSPG